MPVYGPYKGLVREVHDGDTVSVDLDLGFGHVILSKDWDGHPWLSCRVARDLRPEGAFVGINAPELATQAGREALAYAQTLLKPGDRVTVMSLGWDKYGGRFDGTIALPDGRDFGSLMVDSGHAVEHDYA
jgi:endonuclease YncB( thermonuclease family)